MTSQSFSLPLGRVCFRETLLKAYVNKKGNHAWGLFQREQAAWLRVLSNYPKFWYSVYRPGLDLNKNANKKKCSWEKKKKHGLVWELHCQHLDAIKNVSRKPNFILYSTQSTASTQALSPSQTSWSLVNRSRYPDLSSTSTLTNLLWSHVNVTQSSWYTGFCYP